MKCLLLSMWAVYPIKENIYKWLPFKNIGQNDKIFDVHYD